MASDNGSLNSTLSLIYCDASCLPSRAAGSFNVTPYTPIARTEREGEREGERGRERERATRENCVFSVLGPAEE